jgi:hypothetical protein
MSAANRGVKKMKSRSIMIAVLLLAVMSVIVVAQTPRPALASAAVDPPAPGLILTKTTSQPDGALAGLFSFQKEIPLGPVDVLKEYEGQMILIVQRLDAELASILQAAHTNQITREKTEYLIQERYQVAMMQYEVLGALHEILEHDVAESAAAKRSGTGGQSDKAVAVWLPSARADSN